MIFKTPSQPKQARWGQQGVEHGLGGLGTGCLRRRRRLGSRLERISASPRYATRLYGMLNFGASRGCS